MTPGDMLQLVGDIATASQPHTSITQGFTAGEFAMIVAGGVLTLAVLAFFVVLFIRASKEHESP